jgi:paraquat-inducible protein B
MSKQANKTLIGVFVLGAVALFVAAALIFGGGKFFRNTQKVVMFFEGSVKGLGVGSPVMFRGVKIGSVTDVKLILDVKDLSAVTPVFVELEPDRWTIVGGEPDVSRMKALIDRGLRAQLQMQSILTGQLMVALDFLPDKPARFVGKVKEYPEIPTVPAPLEELTKTITNLPLKEIANNLNNAIAGLDKLVNSPDMKENVKSIHTTLKDTSATLKDVKKLVDHIDNNVGPLMTDIHGISSDTKESLKQSQKTMKAVEADLAEITASTKKSLESADSALKQAEKTLATYSGDSQLVNEVHRTLRDLSEASRSVENLFDYLERHPEALIKGKPEPEGDTK